MTNNLQCKFYKFLSTFTRMLGFALLMNASIVTAKTEFEFKSKETVQQPKELASNILRVVNRENKPLKFLLNLNLPNEWRSLNNFSRLYEVSPGDSLFIPVKLLFKGNEDGDVSYLVVAGLVSEANQLQFASASWYVRIKKRSEWSAAVNKTEAFFINDSDTSSFNLSLRNTGNSTEQLAVTISPHLGMHVYELPKLKEITAAYSIMLAPGSDTTLSYMVRFKPLNENNFRTGYNNTKDNVNKDKVPLRIAVNTLSKNNSSAKVWRTIIYYRKGINEVKLNNYTSQVLPLTVELNLDNIFVNSTILSLNVYGDTKLDPSRTLSYRFQSFFTDQFFNSATAFRGNYRYVGYFGPKAEVEAGSISGWANFGITPSGEGIKAEHAIGSYNRVGLLYIQSPTLFSNPFVQTIGAKHDLILKKASVSSYFQQTTNNFLKSNGLLAVTGGDFRLVPQHTFTIRGGASREQFPNASPVKVKDGFGGNLGYSGSIKNFSLRAFSTYGSKYYSNYRGVFNNSFAFTYKQSIRYSWMLTNSFYRQNPVYFDQKGNDIGGFHSRSDRYELRFSVMGKKDNYTLRAAYNFDELPGIRYNIKGLGFDYRPAISNPLMRFYVSIFGGYNKLIDYDIPNYFTAQVRSSFRYKNFSSTFRYNYGPFQAYQQLLFAQNQINHQSIYINMNYGIWLLRNKVSFDPTFSFSHESLYQRNRLSFRPQIYFFTKSGLDLNVYAQYLYSSQKIYNVGEVTSLRNIPDQTEVESLLFGIGLKKQFGMPIPGKKYFSAQVVIFKDLNGNLIQDKNEDAIENVLVNMKSVSTNNPDTIRDDEDMSAHNLHGEDLVTDAKGKVNFKNFPAGVYTLTAKPLTTNSGWFPSITQEIVLGKNTEIAMPFSKGIRIVGSILVNHNSNLITGNKNPEISSIRVTASDSSGKSYTGLTGKDGSFEIYAPAGNYNVTLNEKAIDANYKVEQPSIKVNLSGSSGSYNISFQITERERKVTIKKFNPDGSIAEPQKEDKK